MMTFFTSICTFFLSIFSYAFSVNVSNKIIIASKSNHLISEARNSSHKYSGHLSKIDPTEQSIYIDGIDDKDLESFIKELQENTDIKIQLVDPEYFHVGTQDDMT